MITPVHKFSPDEMVSIIDANLSGMIPIVSKMGRLSADDPPGVMRSIVDIPYSLFNGIANTRLTPNQVEPAIQYIIADSKNRHVPILWWITPSTQPGDLEEHLKDYGFKLHDDEPGMAVELANLNEELPKVPGFSIQYARDDDSWQQWGRTMADGFGIPPAAGFVVTAWHELLSRVDPEAVLAFIGYLDGQPVATSLLSLVGSSAGIYGVSTIPRARRKGIGAWMTLHPLLYAGDKGCHVGMLQASQMGMGVYQSLGFREYCQIRSYQFRP